MAELTMHDEPRAPAWTGRTLLTHGALDGGHEAATHEVVAERLAALLNLPYAGACEIASPLAPAYLVPRAPLAGRAAAERYAIRNENDLFGGWVPEDWMAAKAIMHPLVAADAAAPESWPRGLPSDAGELTLRGYTAFVEHDALTAGRLLLRSAPVRLKPVRANGGRGQIVARSERELRAALASFCSDGRLSDILVVEENLEDVATYSVGQVRLPDRTISYWGTQSLTRDNHGATAYGGSILLAVSGGFDRLMRREMPAETRDCIERAVAFDALADRHIPGLIASRRNYDVAYGVAADGTRRIGILEQSWRMGGATGAEIAAFEAFALNPSAAAVRARTVETYGRTAAVPAGATLYFRGSDPAVGPLTKYACVEETFES